MLGTWFSGFVAFVIIWWVVFFVVLPFGVRTPEEAAVALEPGQAASAPVRPRIALKFALTTAIASALWGVYFYLGDSGLLVLQDLGR
jgi:predicted secreted protein